jgi:hypothetical protein
MHGIVERIRRDEQNGSIRADDGREFYFESIELANVSFDNLLLGMKVDFDALEPMASDGLQARDIHVDGEVKPLASGEVPPSKSENPDVEAIASQTPPAAAQDSVDESSWESFPASDPPAKHETT